jgi:hypothetical protein
MRINSIFNKCAKYMNKDMYFRLRMWLSGKMLAIACGRPWV